MPESQLVYQLEGKVQEIDVFKLAPTLLALGELIRDSNRELFPKGKDLGVNARPFRKGSFIIGLTVVSPSHLQQLLDFIKPHSIEQLNQLLKTIGLIATGAGSATIGAVQAIKFLKGKPKSVEQISAGEIRYTANDGNSITVNGPVHSLLSTPWITQNIYNIYGPPMMDDINISGIKTYSQGHKDTAVVVKRNDVPIIKEFATSVALTVDSSDTVKETTHYGVPLNPKRGAFGGDPKDWSFWRGDGIITANIKDRSFLAKYANGEYRLNESDLLTVDLLEHQRIRGTTVQKPTYDIVKVTDYKKGATQSEIPLIGESSD